MVLVSSRSTCKLSNKNKSTINPEMRYFILKIQKLFSRKVLGRHGRHGLKIGSTKYIFRQNCEPRESDFY